MRKAFVPGPWDTTEYMWALQEGPQPGSFLWYVFILLGGLLQILIFISIVAQFVYWKDPWKSHMVQTRLASLMGVVLGLIISLSFGEPCIFFLAVLFAHYSWKSVPIKRVNPFALNLGINERIEIERRINERAEKIEKMRNWLKHLLTRRGP